MKDKQNNESRKLRNDYYMQVDIESAEMKRLQAVCDVAQISMGQAVRFAFDYVKMSANGPDRHFNDGAPREITSLKYYTTRKTNEQLKAIAKKHGVSKAALVRAALKEFVENWVGVMNSVNVRRKLMDY